MFSISFIPVEGRSAIFNPKRAVRRQSFLGRSGEAYCFLGVP
jgi:hypothetical protein